MIKTTKAQKQCYLLHQAAFAETVQVRDQNKDCYRLIGYTQRSYKIKNGNIAPFCVRKYMVYYAMWHQQANHWKSQSVWITWAGKQILVLLHLVFLFFPYTKKEKTEWTHK